MPGQAHELRMGGREWGLLLVLSVLWGTSFFLFKILVEHMPPFTVVLGRVGLAAVALNLVLLARGEPVVAPRRLWGSFLVMGLLNNVVPFSLIVFGETRIASGLASILNATTPIFAVLAAHVLTNDERLTWAKGVGVAFGFMGVSVLIGPDVLAVAGQGDPVGQGACLLAALVYALAGLYGRRFRGVAPLRIATGQVTASMILLIPLSLLIDKPWTLPLPGAGAWAAWLAVALFSTALAYMIYFRILAAAGATNLLLVTFLLPVSALLLGSLFLDEAITPRAIGGAALIGLGLAAIDGRLWRAVTARPLPRPRPGAPR